MHAADGSAGSRRVVTTGGAHVRLPGRFGLLLVRSTSFGLDAQDQREDQADDPEATTAEGEARDSTATLVGDLRGVEPDVVVEVLDCLVP